VGAVDRGFPGGVRHRAQLAVHRREPREPRGGVQRVERSARDTLRPCSPSSRISARSRSATRRS
jgi:hypothetical protein